MFGIDFTRNQKLALVAILGLALAGFSYARLRGSRGEIVVAEPDQDRGAPVVAAGSDPMPGAVSDTGKVVFQVAGCVKAPGVYSLPFGERVIDAVRAAGGAKPNADLESINLAAKIEDGSRIYIPSLADTRAAQSAAASSAVRSAGGGSRSAPRSSSDLPSGKLTTPGSGTVNINSASVEELQQLPGVGPATAEKIVDYRSQIGRFTSAEQLMDVKGIGPKKLEHIRPFVVL